MMKTCVLPIDSRPCSYDFVKDLADINGAECILPPLRIMDDFRQPSDFSTISKWLDTVSCDTLILSIDQLLYGGLLASRQSGISLQAALERLNILKKLKQKNPNLRVFASSVLMRTTVSTLSLESKVWWEDVSQYAKASYFVSIDETDQVNKERLLELEKKIPESVLSEFLSVRKRNHEVNKKCIELVNYGLIDFLLILQEDCSEYGMHRAEQKKLLEIIDKYELQNRVLLHNGTDESTTELLARAASTKPKHIQVKWLGENSDFIALFEDRPFIDNLKSHLNIMNIHEDEESDTILFIYLPKNGQKDFCADWEKQPDSGYDPGELESFAQSIADAINQGKDCYLLDVAFANGGDPELLQSLAKQVEVSKLCGYSAWNTASNALGTILSQIVLSKGENSEANKRFTTSRIMDDVIYQAVIRKRLEKDLRERGLDPFSIANVDLAEALLQVRYEEVKPLIEEIIPNALTSLGFTLRWYRTFEIEICNRSKSKGVVF